MLFRELETPIRRIKAHTLRGVSGKWPSGDGLTSLSIFILALLYSVIFSTM